MTCRTFLEPALDALWREIVSFEPLIACLPESLWREESVDSDAHDTPNTILHLRRDLEPEDLSRYLLVYSYRIREINFDFTTPGLKMLAIESLHALQMATEHRPGALSPALKTFRWFDAPVAQDYIGPEYGKLLSSYMAMFLSGSVEELDVSLDDEDPPLHKASVKIAIKRLHSGIRELVAYHTTMIQYCAQFPWPKLSTLRVSHVSALDTLDFPAIGQLSVLQLSYVSSRSRSLHIPNPNSTNSNALASLRALVGLSFDFHDMLHCIDLLPRSNRLRSIELYALMQAEGAPYQGIFDCIGQRGNPLTLSTVILKDMRHNIYPEALDMDPRQTDLSPLIPFQLLEQLELTMHTALSILPKFIEQIPHFWPHLRCLYLCHEFITSRPPSIDHTHVLRLVCGLSALRDLGIRFDATTITGQEPSPASPPTRLHTLRVGRSPICSPPCTLRFLQSNFPFLETLDIECIPRPQEDTLYKRRWECVLEGWKDARTAL